MKIVKEKLNRQKLRRTMQKKGDLQSYKQYEHQNRLTRRLIRRKKKLFWIKGMENADMIKTFNVIRGMKKGNKNIILSNNGELIMNNKDAADIIVEYFAKVGLNKKRKIEGLRIRTGKEVFNKNDLDKLNSVITDEVVSSAIDKLNIRKACGPDDIYPFMIKYGGKSVVRCLTKLFNKVFDEGKFPKDWNTGTIIPISKVDITKVEPKNFRPICLLSIVGKLFERIINERLMELTELRQILPCYQNGFRKRKNTVLNLRQLQRIIYEAFEGKNKVLAVFLDVKKAYDCVDRKRLLEIIEYLGVKGKVLTWLKHFLGKRYNQAIFNNEMSSRREFSMGVPQGSPISPLLFNIYLSEMKRVFKDNVSQFADDMVLWVTGKDMRKMETKINNKLEKIREFLENRNLLLSPEKCVAVLFCKGPIPKDRPKVIIGGEEIRFENKAKYLGIVMDKGLTWKHHIELISKKNMRTIERLKRIYTKY